MQKRRSGSVLAATLGALMVVAAVACGRQSLDPNSFDRCCCSGSVPVRNSAELRRALAEVEEGCSERTICAMECTDEAVCTNGMCTKSSAASDGG